MGLMQNYAICRIMNMQNYAERYMQNYEYKQSKIVNDVDRVASYRIMIIFKLYTCRKFQHILISLMGYDIVSTLEGVNAQMVGYWINNAARDCRTIELCINRRKS